MTRATPPSLKPAASAPRQWDVRTQGWARSWTRHSGYAYPQDFCDRCRHPIVAHYGTDIRGWRCPDPPIPSVETLSEQAVALIVRGDILWAYGLIRQSVPSCTQEGAELLIYEVSLLIAEISRESRRI